MFGNKDNKRQDKFLSQLAKNQAILIKNNQHFINNEKIHWSWIKKLDSDNKAQSAFDKSVVESLKAQDKKIGTVLELAQQVKELQQTVAELKTNNHKHEVAE